MEWTILDSAYVLNERWMKVRRDTCRLPSGLVIDDYFWLEAPDHTLVVPLTATGEAVLTRQYKHAVRQVLLEFPGGIVDPGEDALAGAKRELLEETGYGGGIWHSLGVFYPNPTKSSARTHVYLAQDVEPKAEPHGDVTEEIEIILKAWTSLEAEGFGVTGSALAVGLARRYLQI